MEESILNVLDRSEKLQEQLESIAEIVNAIRDDTSDKHAQLMMSGIEIYIRYTISEVDALAQELRKTRTLAEAYRAEDILLNQELSEEECEEE